MVPSSGFHSPPRRTNLRGTSLGGRLATLCKHPQDRIEHRIQFLAHVLGKEAQHEVAVLLKQLVLASVATIGDRIRKVLSAVEFDGYAGVGAEQVDFKCSEAVERDR